MSVATVSITTRSRWIDALRGIAIIAVVLGHANIGVMVVIPAGKMAHVLQHLNTAVYSVHMPLFALLFGLNIAPAWEKRQRYSYALRRVLDFLWLYLVWTFIQGSFEVIGARYSNGDTSWSDVLHLERPIGHIWFLLWVAIVYALLILVKPWQGRVQASLALISSALLAVLTWGTNGAEFYKIGISLLFFAVLGSVIGTYRFNSIGNLSFRVLAFVVTVAAVMFGALLYICPSISLPTLEGAHRTILSVSAGIALTLSGIALVTGAIAAVYKFLNISWLEYMGRISLAIYLMHLLFTPTTRVILMKLGIENPIVIIICATLAGCVLPIAVYRVVGKHLWWIFKSPFVIKKNMSSQVGR